MNTTTSDTVFSRQQTGLTLALMLLGLIVLFATAPKPAQVNIADFVPGNHALDLWGGVMGGEGLASSPLWVQYFLKTLFGVSLIGILFMPKHHEARWAAGGLLAGVFNTFYVIPYLPIVSLGGMYAVMHFVLWLPGIYLLLKNRPFLRGFTPYSIWCGVVTGIILFSFIFDVRDSAVYIPYVWNLHMS